MLGKRMPVLRIDQLGQGRAIGFVTNMPGLQPSKLGIGRARTRFRHLGQTQIDRVGQDRRQ